MKTNKLTALALTLMVTFSSLSAQSEASPFLGLWALDLDYSDNKAGWIEVRQENGYLDADILWRWGSVFPLDFAMETDGRLILNQVYNVPRKNEAGEVVKTHRITNLYNMQLTGDDVITGVAIFPSRDGKGMETVKITGKRIPAYGKAPDLSKVKYGKPIPLISKKGLSGWQLLEEGATNGWSVKKGVLKNNPVQKEGEEHIRYGNLRTTETFNDFNLKLEVNVPEGSNSGVYLKGIYEIQVMDSYGKALDPHNMGALYSRITPSEAAEKPAGEWQTMDITLCKRHVTVVLNGKTIIDNQAVKGITGGAMSADEFVPGPIYLQGDHGAVSYRKIVLTPIM